MNGPAPTALETFFRGSPAKPADAPTATRRVEVQPRSDAFVNIYEAKKSLKEEDFSSALLAAWASWWVSEVERLETEGTKFQGERSRYLMRLPDFSKLEEEVQVLQDTLTEKKVDPKKLVPFVRRLSRNWWDRITPTTQVEKNVKDALDRLRSEARKFKTKTDLRTGHQKTKWRELFYLQPRVLTDAIQASKRSAMDFLSHYFPFTRDEKLQKPLQRELRAIWESIFTEARKAKEVRDKEKIELLMKRARNDELWEG